jgi:hypothetical protein
MHEVNEKSDFPLCDQQEFGFEVVKELSAFNFFFFIQIRMMCVLPLRCVIKIL